MSDLVVIDFVSNIIEVQEAAPLSLVIQEQPIQTLEVVAVGPQGPLPIVPASIGYVFDGGASVLAIGFKGFISVPFDCIIESWTLTAFPPGSMVVDIWKSTFAGFPPSVSNSITGGAKPSITSDQKNSSSSLGAWTTAVAAGDIIAFNIDSVSVITLASISLKVTRT